MKAAPEKSSAVDFSHTDLYQLFTAAMIQINKFLTNEVKDFT